MSSVAPFPCMLCPGVLGTLTLKQSRLGAFDWCNATKRRPFTIMLAHNIGTGGGSDRPEPARQNQDDREVPLPIVDPGLNVNVNRDPDDLLERQLIAGVNLVEFAVFEDPVTGIAVRRLMENPYIAYVLSVLASIVRHDELLQLQTDGVLDLFQFVVLRDLPPLWFSLIYVFALFNIYSAPYELQRILYGYDDIAQWVFANTESATFQELRAKMELLGPSVVPSFAPFRQRHRRMNVLVDLVIYLIDLKQKLCRLEPVRNGNANDPSSARTIFYDADVES